MALSGSFNTNKYSTQSSGTIGLNLSWTAEQSIANNSTIISWTLKSNGTMSSGYSVYGGPITVTIGGTTVFSQTSRVRVYGGGSYKKSGTITIQHDEDGTKTISMSVKAALYAAQVNCTGSATYTLDTINRYALISSADNFTDEGNPSITYTNPAGTTLTTDLKVRITWNNGANATAFYTLNDEGGTTTLNLTTAERNAMLSACPNSNTLAVQFDLQSTMEGTDYHNYKDAVMTVVNANPTAGAVTYQDTNSATVAITGDNQKIVQLHSTLQIHTAASTAKKYASIATYSLSINGHDYTPDGSGNVTFTNPDVAGTYTAVVTTTDSRGNTATASVDITILNWTEPNAVYSLARIDNFYTDTIINVDGKIASLDGSNTLTITEKHRKIGESTWSAETTLQDATDTTIQLDNLYEWEVLISVTDAFATTTYTATVGKGIPTAFFDTKRNSFGVNGFPDEDHQLYVGGNIKATGGASLGTPLPVASGGTGSGTAAGARTNLGIECTSLLSQPLSTGSTTIDVAGYKAILLIGKGGSTSPSTTCYVPIAYLSANEVAFSFTYGYNSQYTYIYLSISGTTVTIRFGGTNNSGSLQAVYGVN